MTDEYYFISDLHLGGDQDLDACDFEPELIGFLAYLERMPEKKELMIAGDMFGLWETSGTSVMPKLRKIIRRHRKLLQQFHKTSATTKITLLVGNHDHELIGSGKAGMLLSSYGIRLAKNISITRRIGNKKIWVEHGSQQDDFNYVGKVGDPYSLPVGYYIASKIISSAGRYSRKSRQRWLSDMESVYPNEFIPSWLFSNFFYREMSFWLRNLMAPFLILLGVTFVFVIIGLFGYVLFESDILFGLDLGRFLGPFGDVLDVVLMINIVLLSLIGINLFVFGLPLLFVIRDFRRAMGRYGFRVRDNLKARKEKIYVDHAKKVFFENPDVAVFVYGHTHLASLRRIGNKAIINTGTWIKKLRRIRSRFTLLPPVYYPSYRLNYFRIREEKGKIIIDYRQILKKTKPQLTWLERIVVFKRKKSDGVEIAPRTVLEQKQDLERKGPRPRT